ncbi:MAG: DJ-1 family protein, partial [Verrucomicrobia bacterium]
TAHFSHKDELPDLDSDKEVVIDQNILTSQGPGTALSFGLAIVEVLEGKEVANEIRKNICYRS